MHVTKDLSVLIRRKLYIYECIEEKITFYSCRATAIFGESSYLFASEACSAI